MSFSAATSRKAQLAALPQVPIDDSMLDKDGQAKCTVCHETAELGAEVTLLPCKHWFHEDCIKPWLRTREDCPSCLSSVLMSITANDANPVGPVGGHRMMVTYEGRGEDPVSPKAGKHEITGETVKWVESLNAGQITNADGTTSDAGEIAKGLGDSTRKMTRLRGMMESRGEKTIY